MNGGRALRLSNLFVLLVALFGLFFPLLLSNGAVVTYAIFTLIFVSLASAWNLLSGFSGYVSLGQASFYGIGAYAMAMVCQSWHIATGGLSTFGVVPLAGLIAAAFSVPIGLIALRTRKHSFVVITIAFIFLLQLLAFNLQGITQGSTGLAMPIPPWSGNSFNTPFYYAVFALALGTCAIAYWVRHSKFGLGLLAIRDDEDRALGFGVPAGLYKLAAFVLSAFLIGMAGAIDGYFTSYIYPQFVLNPTIDITMAAMGFFGGLGTLAGPIVGALVLEPVQQLLAVSYGDLSLVVFGAVLLAVVVFLPEGVVPTTSRYLRQALARGQSGQPAGGAAAAAAAPPPAEEVAGRP